MEYELIAVDLQGEIGYIVRKSGLYKLEGTNIYRADEFDEAEAHVEDMNDRAALRAYWPMPSDPDVEALLMDPAFDPVEYDEVDVIDIENSEIVHDAKPGARIGTDPVSGDPIFGPREIKYDDTGLPSINWMASSVVYKKEWQPKRTQNKSRIEVASERVARARLADAQKG